jgi:hypothetical protein
LHRSGREHKFQLASRWEWYSSFLTVNLEGCTSVIHLYLGTLQVNGDPVWFIRSNALYVIKSWALALHRLSPPLLPILSSSFHQSSFRYRARNKDLRTPKKKSPPPPRLFNLIFTPDENVARHILHDCHHAAIGGNKQEICFFLFRFLLASELAGNQAHQL